MIPHHKVDTVRELLAAGTLSHRNIAEKVGISRATVGEIATGRRPDFPPRATPADELFATPSGPPVRCDGCGGRVYMPCRLCEVRQSCQWKRLVRKRQARLGRYLAGRGW